MITRTEDLVEWKTPLSALGPDSVEITSVSYNGTGDIEIDLRSFNRSDTRIHTIKIEGVIAYSVAYEALVLIKAEQGISGGPTFEIKNSPWIKAMDPASVSITGPVKHYVIITPLHIIELAAIADPVITVRTGPPLPIDE